MEDTTPKIGELTKKYGKISSEVLLHDNFMTEMFLYDCMNITRSYILMFFKPDKNNRELSEIDKKIKNGALMGDTFRQYGYQVRKNTIGLYLLDNPKWLQEKFQHSSSTSKARLSEFYAKKAYSEPVIYGTVLEVYSPDFRAPEIIERDLEQVHPTTPVLEQAGFTRSEIYYALGDEGRDHFNIEDDRYANALEFMELIPDPTHKKFLKYIGQK